MTTNLQQTYKEQFTTDLARMVGCKPDELPASVPQHLARKYLNLSGPRTLNDWASRGRYNIQTVRVGRNVEVMTDWLVSMKVDGLRIPQQSN